MRIAKGHSGDVDLAGMIWGGVVRWPGPIHEGNGEMHSSLAYVHHGSAIRTGAHEPTVVEKAFEA